MALFQKGQATPLALKRIRFDLGNETYINLRELSAQELMTYQENMGDKPTSNADFVYDLIATCACDDQGNKLFDDRADVKANFPVGLSTMIEMQNAIMRVSGIEQKN